MAGKKFDLINGFNFCAKMVLSNIKSRISNNYNNPTVMQLIVPYNVIIIET